MISIHRVGMKQVQELDTSNAQDTIFQIRNLRCCSLLAINVLPLSFRATLTAVQLIS